jgi:hypothetical protein
MAMINYPVKQNTYKYANTKCDKFSHLDKSGNMIYIPKKKFNSDKEAIEEAKRINVLPKTIHKVVAYKCITCHLWHVGRTKKELKHE